MTTGVVRGRTVELEGDPLPEGTRVRVMPDAGAAPEEIKTLTLGEWIDLAEQGRARRPRVSDSTDLLREMREERAGR